MPIKIVHVDGMVIKSWYPEPEEDVEKAWSAQARAAAAAARRAKGGGGGVKKPGFIDRAKAAIKEQFRAQSNQELGADEWGKHWKPIGLEKVGRKIGGTLGRVTDKVVYRGSKPPALPKGFKSEANNEE